MDFIHYSSILIRLFVAWTGKILQRFQTRCYVHTVLDSFQFIQKMPATRSSEGILLLDDTVVSEIEGHRETGDATKKN